MRRRRNENEERRVEHLLEALRRNAEAPPEHALRAMARAAATARPLQPGRPAGSYAGRFSRPQLRWATAVAAALLLGSGLGFGFGTRLTPSGSARNGLVGVGFLPTEGWTVVQSEPTGPARAATAIAANVALDPEDDPRSVPYATLAKLPAHGVVIVATLATRGDPDVDVEFPVRSLPLRLGDATRSPAATDPPTARRLPRFRLRAGVGGHNVEARIYFGATPSEEAAAAAQRQLSRLVVAPERVTIAVRRSIARWDAPATLFGSISSGNKDEIVTIEARECGPPAPSFREVTSVRTREEGAWSVDWFARSTTAFRAKWRDATSAGVVVRKRPGVLLSRQAGRRFEVGVSAIVQFWRKRVVIERYDRRVGKWIAVKSVVLTETGAPSGGSYVWTSAEFRLVVPRRTLLRAVLPLAQARPCYMAGYSNLLRT